MDTKHYAGHDADMRLLAGFSFTKNPEGIPLTYNYRGVQYTGLPENALRTEKKEGSVTKITYTAKWMDGITLRAECITYENYPVEEWVCFFTNDGQESTGILTGVASLNAVFRGQNPKVKTNTGDFHSVEGFIDTLHTLAPGTVVKSIPDDGRSCNGCWPYQKLMFDDYGMNIAIGWSGTWFSEYVGDEEWAHVVVGQHRCHTYLKPGETFRTPMITFMPYQGNEDHGVNVWRRWFYEHILIRENGLPLKGKTVFAEGGGGEEFTKADEANQLGALALLKKHDINPGVWWIDAGWYSLDVDTKDYTEARPPQHGSWTNTGSWRHDEIRFPNGLRPVGEKCAEMGMDFLMWFEPLRVRLGTELEKERPEWMMKYPEYYGHNNRLLDITNPDCLQWLCEHVSGLIKEYKIKWYREDFNFPPLMYWIFAETDDRRGMVENKYIQAFYQYWDYLKAHNPEILIDSCASGGRRNDMETMRRAVPLHHTDFGYGYKPVCQAFSYSMHRWLPYFKSFLHVWDDGDGTYPPQVLPEQTITGKDEQDSYSMFNNIGPMMSLYSAQCLEENPDTLAYIKNIILPTWEKAGPLMLAGDFYSLTEPHRDSKKWTVFQFHANGGDNGLIKTMRNQQCEVPTQQIYPKGLNPDKTYTFTNAESGEAFTLPGSEIINNGIECKQPIRSAAIWFYDAQ